jgi:hypothetical protein
MPDTSVGARLCERWKLSSCSQRSGQFPVNNGNVFALSSLSHSNENEIKVNFPPPCEPFSRFVYLQSTFCRQGWVWVLDSITGFKKTMTVQEPDKLRDSNSYVWPCHKVLVVDHVSEKDDRDAAERSQAAIISSFQVATLLTPNTIALYLVDAFKFGGSTFTPDSVKQPATTVATISLEASPVDFELHPSHNYIYLLSEAGLVHVKHVKPAGDPARGGLEALPTLEADQVFFP